MPKSEIYWNSHRKCFSIRQGGRVIAHAEAFVMLDCELPVSIKVRDRVRATGRKKVHAVVRGTLAQYRTVDGVMARDDFVQVPAMATNERVLAYNPMKHDSFVSIPTLDPIHTAHLVGGRVNQGRPFMRAWDAL